MADSEASKPGEQPLVDELGVKDLKELIFAKKGRLFSTAGRDSPVAELTEDGLVLHPPQKPLEEEGPVEKIELKIDERGVWLDELGKAKKVAGAKYRGHELFWMGECEPGTNRHLVAWFDEEGKAHRLLLEGKPLTTGLAFKLRNRTHDGELSIFDDVTSE